MRKRKIHNLKIWPAEFKAVMKDKKTFEYRKNDRDFRVKDYINLNEWDPVKKEYTGESCAVQITYMLTEGFGLKKGYCVMSIKAF